MGPALLLAELVCVVAAAVMTWQSRGVRVRMAHAIMLLAMVALAVDMASALVQVVSVLALLGTGAWMLLGSRDAAGRSCALDLGTCAALVALMGATTLWRAGTPDAATMPGMTMSHASAGLSGPAQVAVPALAAGVVLGWALLRRTTGRPEGARGGSLAAWSMVLGMAAMTLA